MGSIINKIFLFIEKNKLITENSKIIVGLSGGPDSVFLLILLKKLQEQVNFELIAVHLNHEWRSNAHLDVEFCGNLTKKFNINFLHSKASELNLNIKNTGSKEDLGRKMRRIFFEEILKKYNANKIALAHHLQDQEETFFIRLIRGTTLNGLTCMKPLDGLYIRPLLETNKSEILEYLKNNNIDYLVDPSNESPEFLRNRVRKIIPLFQETDNRFDNNFLRTLNSLTETEEFLIKLTQEEFNKLTHIADNNIILNINLLLDLDIFLQNKIIILWLIKSKVKFELKESLIKEILRFLKQKNNGSHTIYQNWSITKSNGQAWIDMIN